MLRNWSELLSFIQSSKSFHHFSDCIEFVIRFAAFKRLKPRSVLVIFFDCLFARSGLGVALRNLAFLEIDVHNNWRPFRPQISFVIDQVSDQSSLEV